MNLKLTVLVFMCGIVTVLLGISVAHAYEQTTHRSLSGSASLKSTLSDPSKLKDMGLLYLINSENQKFPNSESKEKQVIIFIVAYLRVRHVDLSDLRDSWR